MSSIKNILIYSLYMTLSLQHTLFDLLSSEPYTQTNSLSIKKELIFSIIKILPLEIQDLLTRYIEINIPNVLQITSFCSILLQLDRLSQESQHILLSTMNAPALYHIEVYISRNDNINVQLTTVFKCVAFCRPNFSQIKYEIIQKHKTKLCRVKCFHNLRTLIENQCLQIS